MIEEEIKKAAAFTEWANANGINMDDEEDWKPWQDCWHDGYDRRDKMAQEENEVDWISVGKRVPPHSELIVYYMSTGKGSGTFHVGIAHWTASKKWSPDIYSEKNKKGFTHWLPLPDIPNVEKER